MFSFKFKDLKHMILLQSDPRLNEFCDLELKTNKNEGKTRNLMNSKPQINELFEFPIFFFFFFT